MIRRVAQGLTQFVYGACDTPLKIDIGIGAPDLVLQLFAREDLARPRNGCPGKRTRNPDLRISPASRSTSKVPKETSLCLDATVMATLSTRKS